MNTLLYKIKNKLFRYSKEAKKIKRPSYAELLTYKSYIKGVNNKLILSFGAGRCGQNWFAKIFNSHPNWIGTCERFSDFEAFYRYISYYNLSIDKENFLEFYKLACKRDFAKYQNTLMASTYFAFGVEELYKRLNPDYVIFNLRDPIKSVESFFIKGWYLDFVMELNKNKKSPLINVTNNLTRAFSRVVPSGEFYNEWLSLTRVGKITWFWANTNKFILDSLNKIENIDKFFLKLEDIDQNYDFYQNISNKFNFENKLSKKEFYNVINKAPNKGLLSKYEYKNWTSREKKEYQDMVDKIFPYYDNIKTNI